ncbi:MAG: Crp/Fnr family transcriptional regulator [Aquabacterium sp.]|nr:Crp/Fnr family transcriptional regulator [Aquabacterium sp.]
MSYISTPDAFAESRLYPVAFQGGAPTALQAPPGKTKPQVAVETLAGVPLFSQLEPALLRQLADRAVVRKLARHATVLEQGSRDQGLFILLRGQAQLVRHNLRGRSLVIDQLRPGDHFGELSAIDEQPQSAAVRCTMPSEVLVFGRTDFIDCLHESQTLLTILLQMMVKRVRRKNRRITLLALHDVRCCVVQQLLDLAELQDGQPVVRGRICRQAIADMIGASRAMVSRVMMALTRSGELQTLADGSTAIFCQPTSPVRQPLQRAAARRPAAG